MNALRAAREYLGDCLDGVVNASVYNYPAPIVSAPAIVIVIDEPMAEVKTIGSRLRFAANYKLQVCVAPMDNLGALEAIEALVVDVLAAMPDNVIVGPVSAPNVTTVGDSDLVVVEIPAQVQTEES
jgi:hypothetical protein